MQDATLSLSVLRHERAGIKQSHQRKPVQMEGYSIHHVVSPKLTSRRYPNWASVQEVVHNADIPSAVFYLRFSSQSRNKN